MGSGTEVGIEVGISVGLGVGVGVGSELRGEGVREPVGLGSGVGLSPAVGPAGALGASGAPLSDDGKPIPPHKPTLPASNTEDRTAALHPSPPSETGVIARLVSPARRGRIVVMARCSARRTPWTSDE